MQERKNAARLFQDKVEQVLAESFSHVEELSSV